MCLSLLIKSWHSFFLQWQHLFVFESQRSFFGDHPLVRWHQGDLRKKILFPDSFREPPFCSKAELFYKAAELHHLQQGAPHHFSPHTIDCSTHSNHHFSRLYICFMLMPHYYLGGPNTLNHLWNYSSFSFGFELGEVRHPHYQFLFIFLSCFVILSHSFLITDHFFLSNFNLVPLDKHHPFHWRVRPLKERPISPCAAQLTRVICHPVQWWSHQWIYLKVNGDAETQDPELWLRPPLCSVDRCCLCLSIWNATKSVNTMGKESTLQLKTY